MPETGEQQRQRVAENLRRLKAANRPQSEIDQYLASERVEVGPERSAADTAGATAQAFSDAATFGLSGLADDAVTAALTKGTFKDLREARKSSKAALPTGVRLGAELAGSLAMPLPGAGFLKGVKGLKTAAELGQPLRGAAKGVARAVSPANRLTPRLSPLLAKPGVKLAENAIETGAQAGLTAGVENLDELSGEGVKQAVGSVAPASLAAMAIGVPLASAVGRAGRVASRMRQAGRLDKQALRNLDLLKDIDQRMYGRAANEAASTPPIAQYLAEDEVAAPIAAQIRHRAQYAGKPVEDAQLAMATYRQLSEIEAGLLGKKASKEAWSEDVAGRLDMVRASKQKLLDAVEAPSEVVTMGRAVTQDVPPVTGTTSSPPLSTRDAIQRFNQERAEGMWKRADVRGQKPGETVMQSQAREALDRRIVEGRAPQTSGVPQRPTTARAVTRPSETIEIGKGIPSLRKAIKSSQGLRALNDTYNDAVKFARQVIKRTDIKPEKLGTRGEAAYLRQIGTMDPEHANMALQAIVSELASQPHVSTNMLSGFGLYPSVGRPLIGSIRLRNVLQALDKQRGVGRGGETLADLLRGAVGRTVGAESNP